MILGLITLLAVVISIVVWGVVVYKWVMVSASPLSSERRQRAGLFITTYILMVVAAALIGFLVSEILQPSPPSPPSPITAPLSKLGVDSERSDPEKVKRTREDKLEPTPKKLKR